MTPELLTLAASVVALPGWRWMPGMLTANGARVCQATVYADGGILLDLGDGSEVTNELGDEWRKLWRNWDMDRETNDPADAPLPDLTDAATGGAMLELLGGVGAITNGQAIVSVPGTTLAEACARVALALGGWRT